MKSDALPMMSPSVGRRVLLSTLLLLGGLLGIAEPVAAQGIPILATQ